MTETSRLLDNVRERDLDLVVTGALFSSESFRAFVLNRTIGWTERHSLVRTCVSEIGDFGESDIVMVVDLEGADRLAVMIEDKISAPFQAEQANRYRQRGELGVQQAQWKRFTTCLCAPEGYIAEAGPAEWDAHISLESISQWAKHSNDSYGAFLAAICEEAVAKRDARVREKSPLTSAFWQAYRNLAAELLPGLNIARLPSLVGLASPWPRFGVTALPVNMLLEHKPQQGRVDLTFAGSTLDTLWRRVPDTLPFDVKRVRTGQSAALRIAVPRIDHFRPFDEQEDEVLSAFAAVERLLAIGQRIAAAPSPTSDAVVPTPQSAQ